MEIDEPVSPAGNLRGLQDRFALAGFRTDLGRFLPHCAVVALPSYTEGLPVIVLEAAAAGVPICSRICGICFRI